MCRTSAWPFLVLLIFGVILGISNVFASEEGMHNMPKIAPKRTYSVSNQQEGDRLSDQRGYGDQEPEVRMMNLMMVGGSGYEGMEMSSPVRTVPSPAEGQTSTYDITAKMTPDPPRVGVNTLEIYIQDKNKKKPARSLNIKARVSMTNMDMGVDEPQVQEISPGKYRLKIAFSMKGSWAVELALPESGTKTLTFAVGAK